MFAALARAFRHPVPRTPTPAVPSSMGIDGYRTRPSEVERRRQVLRDAVLGFEGLPRTTPFRSGLDGLGISFRMDDISELGVTAWAPVRTWCRKPGPRRAAWLVYRHRTDPWWTDAHAFVTLDGVTMLHFATMPTQLVSEDEQLSFRVRFGIVSDEPEWEHAEDATARLAGRIPAVWHSPSSWSVPSQGYLTAVDADHVAGKLAGLLSGMIETLDLAGPTRPFP